MRFLTGTRSVAPLPAAGRFFVVLALLASLGLLASSAGAEELHEKLDRKQEQLGKVRERQGILTSELQRMGRQISRLEGEVSGLRARELAVQVRLDAKQAELDGATAELRRAQRHFAAVRARLQRALVVLRERLIAIYESGSPDLLNVVLSSEGWSEVVGRAEYLNRIQEQDEAIAGRVRDLRDEAEAVVERQRLLRDRIAAARDAIAAQQAELQSTRVSLQARRNGLLAARGERRGALDGLEERRHVLEGDVSDLQAEIQTQLGSLPMSSVTGAIGGSGTLAWPVHGTLTSGFGYRWGRMHEGIDIGVAEGTPIAAAAPGTVVLQQGEAESGGYGNYTCIDHGGGLATCYAHQSSFAVTLGQHVAQGQLIGYVGNTGHSFGSHLHFEVRVGGVAQDPLGYL